MSFNLTAARNAPPTRIEAGNLQAHPAPAPFNPLESPIALSMPRLLSPTSAWLAHIPFAFTLVDLLRPRSIVELGTHHGDSYCAFCQAVDLLNLDCSCTAVDTWTGDPQSGFYDPSVLALLRDHHDPLYGRFSTLLPATFDDAAREFAPASIDLLHLDGLHDYHAVRHDYLTWRPKLSDSAVVLFHDTRLDDPSSGVHRLWNELSPLHPHFEFTHGYGLGVLLVGKYSTARFCNFLATANHNADPVRRYFAALGQRLELARGIATVSGDLREHHKHTAAWRTERHLPAHGVGLIQLDPTALADLENADTKAALDGLHQLAEALAQDTRQLTSDNANLRTAANHFEEQLQRTALSRLMRKCTGLFRSRVR